MKTIYEKSRPGRRGVSLPMVDLPSEIIEQAELPAGLMREKPAELPEMAEVDVVRHFTNLSQLNFSVDNGMYPLGSCTMKYNPKVCEDIARLPGFAGLHPLLPQLKGGNQLTQGALTVIYETEMLLAEVTGMDAFTVHPMAGAHGELTGIMIMAAYHRDKGNDKDEIIIPDSAHGTNPASAAFAGYKVISVPSDENGMMDLAAFDAALSEKTAGVMMTNPSTVGLFDINAKKIAEMAHGVDALMYYDGANMNAIMGYAKPAELGFDVVHLNLHKTFGTPHGGGGPGSGPVGVVKRLEPYLPISRVAKAEDGSLFLDYDRPKSIGYVAPFYGNFGVALKAYAYMIGLGGDGLKRASQYAVLNANYLRVKLAEHWKVAYDQPCMHEVVLTAEDKVEKYGISALDVAKALIDAGYHPPTIYFPLIVHEALMIEPTETESVENLDAFVQAMAEIAQRAKDDPESLHAAPVTKPVGRLDEVSAARNPNLCFAA